MITLFKNKIIIGISILILILINVALLIKKNQEVDKGFDVPVSIGTTLNYEWTNSKKEILFVFIKPKCGTCALYKDSINALFDKYNSIIQFKGLCNPKNWDEEYFKTYNFHFITINSEIRNALHLAFTPQFVLVENNKITFVCNFYSEFNNEFKRLKQYLEKKYTK